jgi:TldD protein
MKLTSLAFAPFAPTGKYPLSVELLHQYLQEALSSGGDYADLFFEYRVSSSLSLEEEKIKNVGRGITVGVGVRVLSGESSGYAYSEDLRPESIREAARTAAAIAHSGRKTAAISVTPKHFADRYALTTPSAFVPGQDKLSYLHRANQAARAASPQIQKVEVALIDEYREICIVSSDGVLVSDIQPMLQLRVHSVAEHNGKRQGGNSGAGGRVGLDFLQKKTPESLGQEASRIALAMLDARPAPAGQFPVVLAKGDSGILLHEAVGHGLEADFNRKKTSNYSDRIGTSVASELCTIVDDPSIDASRGSINVDDEGNEPTKSTLIENGILRGYLHDRLSAQHFKIKPSGNGRRQSFHSLPMPRMTNTYMLGGQDDPEEIIKSVQKGIYAVRFSGGQVNISNGDFVFSLTEGYLIEDGKITAPLKGVNLIGNGPEALTKVVSVGHDFALSDGTWTCGKDGQSVPVGVGIPTVKISSITVGGTEV